jgi:hypothetical protein
MAETAPPFATEAEADAALAARLAGHRVLLCNGLFGEVIAGLRMDYMTAQLDWLTSLGLDAARVALPTAAPVAANAARIAEAILADPAPCLLIAHSKGGLEALSALLLPGAAARCRGLLALQSPFHGSPIADLALSIGPLREVADHALRLAGLGDGEGLADLTCATRQPFMAAEAKAIAALAATVPVTSLATQLPAEPAWRDRAYQPFALWMEREGHGPSDGLVPVASTRLPGARHAVLEGGHRALIAAGAGRDPVALLRTELPALLDRSTRPPPPP